MLQDDQPTATQPSPSIDSEDLILQDSPYPNKMSITTTGENGTTYLLSDDPPPNGTYNTYNKYSNNEKRGVLSRTLINVYKRVYIARTDRPDVLLFVLMAFFFVNTATAELISGKLFQVGPFSISIGSVMWPVVFIITDLTNEFFGKRHVRRLSIIMSCLLVYMYALLQITIRIPASSFSPVSQADYSQVFGQSGWIIVGSLVAFLVGQLVDITVYHILRTRTQGKHLWLRSTGSNLISQLVDTYIVNAIAFLVPGKISVMEYVNLATVSYVYKVLVAIVMTPIIYVAHYAVDWMLGKQLAEELVAKAMLSGIDDDTGDRRATANVENPNNIVLDSTTSSSS